MLQCGDAGPAAAPQFTPAPPCGQQQPGPSKLSLGPTRLLAKWQVSTQLGTEYKEEVLLMQCEVV
jgi:hypothetical protein